ELHNAEYDLGVALLRSGAHDAALGYLLRAVARGPSSPYFAPAHRQIVDLALETGDHLSVLAKLQAIDVGSLPVEVSDERTYLKARAAYGRGDLAAADADLAGISRRSRMYGAALYLRGVLAT